MRRLAGWLDPSWTITEDELPPGFVLNRVGRMVELENLKAGDVFDGDLSFRSVDEEQDEYLLPIPDGVVIRGDVYVSGSDLLSRMKAGRGDEWGMLQRLVMRSGVKIEGGLDLKYVRLHADELDVGLLKTYVCEVTKLPKRITAGVCEFRRTVFDDVGDTTFASWVRFFDCVDVRLGEGVTFERDVQVEDCSKVGMFSNPAVKFGNGTVFQGELNMTRADIDFDGEITCEKTVRLRHCHDVRMPDALMIGEGFFVLDAVIDRWPPRLEVAGEFSVAETGVASEDLPSAPSRKFG